MICVVDYGVGNLGSIKNMIKKIGQECVISSNREIIQKSRKLILSGVGSFDYGMQKIRELNLFTLLNEEVKVKKKPILGICLGMQLMTKSSDEGITDGLSWVDASTYKFKSEKLKIPHMGWNTVITTRDSLINKDFFDDTRFYFVHSHYVRCKNLKNQIFSTNYGINFTSGFQKDNIYGVQFHPEKSHKYGKKLMENFCKIEV